MAKTFLDTSVLVYAMDRHDRVKRRTARLLISKLRSSGEGVVSTQVLQEFYVVATRKLSLDPLRVKPLLIWFERYLEVVVVSAALIREAIDIAVINQMSFWDGLILSAAESARATVVATDDLHAGSIVRGVRIDNPFATPRPRPAS